MCTLGVRIRQEKGLLSLGKTEDVKIYRDDKGALKIMADSIDFVAKSVTVSCTKKLQSRVHTFVLTTTHAFENIASYPRKR